jgi:manganese-transporting P-type ATPase
MAGALLYGCDCDSKRIESVSVYRPKMALSLYKNIRLYHFVFVALYAIMGSLVVQTIGEPYQQFLKKADQQGFAVMQGTTRYKAELEHALYDINDPHRRTKKIGWTDWMEYDIEELAAEKKRDLERNVLDSLPKHMRVPNKYAPAFWPTLLTGILATFHALVLLLQVWSVSFAVFMNYSVVSTRKLHIPESMLQLPDDDHEKTLDDDDDSPGTAGTGAKNGTSSSAPGGNAAVAAFPNYQIQHPPSHLPTHARIVPAKRGEKHVLVPLEYFPVLGMTFEYHRRRYVYQANSDSDDENDESDSTSPGTWCKIRCRTNFPLKILGSTTLSENNIATTSTNKTTKTADRKPWSGFSDAHSLAAGQIRYGPNYFSVKQPTFAELYKAQLLNPFSVFQIFCVLLWAIDDYIVYSCFSLFMVLMFEGTVVFQRLRSLQALRGMGNPSRPVLVHRCGHWTNIETTQLLPGDILSLTRVKPHVAVQKQNSNNTGKPMMMNRRIEDEGGDVVPADLLLLRGSTVVNEASLTGESIPQMKEGLGEEYTNDDNENENGNNSKKKIDEPDECLSIKNKHKMNVVYAGTKMLQCKGDPMFAAAAAAENRGSSSSSTSPSTTGPFLFRHISPPPDGGCVCFVLRTGFSSAQGKLVRMIEGSQEKVKGHERETGLLLLLLCLFAIASSSYVLYHGAQDEKRSKYELLLHCILIVTSVIRPELPMQMAMAVNNSLMTLMKMNVFCTEPYRVPTAGKLDACLFDKTGTLTTDELVAVGICTAKTLQKVSNSQKAASAAAASEDLLTPMMKVASEEAAAALVLAGCHSLVVVDGETTGDPLESASLKSMHWQLDLTTHKAVPKPATEKRTAGQALSLNGSSMDQVEILMRHHFSSKLQRMSCVIQAGTTSRGGSSHKFSVAKGSPEAIGRLLGNKPDGYDDKSQYLAKQGYRVIALAYKPLDTEASVAAAMESRAECESNLIFVGLQAFTCRVRKDTADVLKRLKEGGMSIAMVTGDALLTAIHVAREVSIFRELDEFSDGSDKGELDEKNQELKAFLESKRKGGKQNDAAKKKHKAFKPIAYLDFSENDLLYWKSYDDDNKVDDYVADQVPLLAETYDLATSGKCLASAYEQDEGTTKILAHIKVFARMTPDAKETVRLKMLVNACCCNERLPLTTGSYILVLLILGH